MAQIVLTTWQGTSRNLYKQAHNEGRERNGAWHAESESFVRIDEKEAGSTQNDLVDVRVFSRVRLSLIQLASTDLQMTKI